MGMTDTIDLSPEHRSAVVGMLKRYLPDTTVWAYGSRVKWNARPQSDLDLVVFADAAKSMSLFYIREAFEESDLPFRVDIFRWDDIPESFRKNIKAQYVVLQERTKVEVAGEV